ncbi:MAG: hypothetical protein WKF37_01235 [Bryobacteraceae bacterium]
MAEYPFCSGRCQLLDLEIGPRRSMWYRLRSM